MTWLFIYFIVLICSQQLSLFVLSLIINLNCHTFNNHIMILSAQIIVKKIHKFLLQINWMEISQIEYVLFVKMNCEKITEIWKAIW